MQKKNKLESLKSKTFSKEGLKDITGGQIHPNSVMAGSFVDPVLKVDIVTC